MALIQSTRSLLTIEKCCIRQCRGFLYSSKKGLSRELLVWLQQPLDFSRIGILRWSKKKQWEMLCKEHEYLPERHETLGPDLATAHFVVARNGAVKFQDFNTWIKKNADGKYNLPARSDMDLKLEAVDVSRTNMMYTSFDNFVDLDIKYLNVSHCPHIDDWCLDRFVQFRHSLLCLDISGCLNITERGLSALARLQNLKRLRMYDMPNVKHLSLAAILLEEVLPHCVIEGVDYTETPSNVAPSSDELPTFLKKYQEVAFQREKEIQMLVDRDDLHEFVNKTDQEQSVKNT